MQATDFNRIVQQLIDSYAAMELARTYGDYRPNKTRYLQQVQQKITEVTRDLAEGEQPDWVAVASTIESIIAHHQFVPAQRLHKALTLINLLCGLMAKSMTISQVMPLLLQVSTASSVVAQPLEDTQTYWEASWELVKRFYYSASLYLQQELEFDIAFKQLVNDVANLLITELSQADALQTETVVLLVRNLVEQNSLLQQAKQTAEEKLASIQAKHASALQEKSDAIRTLEERLEKSTANERELEGKMAWLNENLENQAKYVDAAGKSEEVQIAYAKQAYKEHEEMGKELHAARCELAEAKRYVSLTPKQLFMLAGEESAKHIASDTIGKWVLMGKGALQADNLMRQLKALKHDLLSKHGKDPAFKRIYESLERHFKTLEANALINTCWEDFIRPDQEEDPQIQAVKPEQIKPSLDVLMDIHSEIDAQMSSMRGLLANADCHVPLAGDVAQVELHEHQDRLQGLRTLLKHMLECRLKHAAFLMDALPGLRRNHIHTLFRDHYETLMRDLAPEVDQKAASIRALCGLPNDSVAAEKVGADSGEGPQEDALSRLEAGLQNEAAATSDHHLGGQGALFTAAQGPDAAGPDLESGLQHRQ